MAKRDGLEGLSLAPQLKDATTKRERPAITSHNQGNHGIRSEKWRYIHYADGTEELYDMVNDPNEWHNVAAKPENAAIIAEHKKWLPKIDVPPAPGLTERPLDLALPTPVRLEAGQSLYVAVQLNGDATSAIPADDNRILIRVKAGPSSGALVVNRLELCIDES